MLWITFPIVGFIISIMSGFFGVGGGFILTPFLLLVGFSPIEAISISFLFSIATSVIGASAHLRQKNIDWQLASILGISGIVATQIAQPFVMFLNEKALDQIVIPCLYILLLAYFAWKMKQETKREVAVTIEKPISNNTTSFIWKSILIGFAGGFVSTTLGVGGGFLMVPLLITLLSFQARKAVGTSLMAVLFIVIIGFITYAIKTPVDYVNGLFLIIGSLLGAPIGAKLTKFYKHHETAKWLSYLYIVIMISVVLKLFQAAFWGLTILGIFIVMFSVNIIKKLLNRNKEIISNI